MAPQWGSGTPAVGDFRKALSKATGAVNPNRYEFWLSSKLKGKSNSPDMKEGFFVDRLVLRRLK